MNFRTTFRALSHRNFQLFFAGQGVSLVGTWMQQVAMAWVVFELTKSPFWLGMVGFASQIPAFFLAPIAGVLVDHWNRHRLILLTQTLAMIQAFALAALALNGVIELWHILVLSVFVGFVNAFDMPARQAFLTEMIERREDLGNAIALNSSVFNGARLVGPALAGLLLATTNAGICFLVNAISYVAVLGALWAMRVAPRIHLPHRVPLSQGVRDGFVYAFGFHPIRSILLLVALVSLAGMSFSVLLPIFATEVLHGGAGTLGLLTTASGVGALIGAICLASRRSVRGLGTWIMCAPAGFGLMLILFAFSHELWSSLLLLVAIGFGLMVHMASSNTVLQTIVDEDKRGRVMSLYTMAFMGMAPLGSLISGSLADWIGPGNTLIAGGLTCMAGSLAFALQYPRLRSLIRPIYVQRGIMPEMSSGLYPALSPPAPVEEEEE